MRMLSLDPMRPSNMVYMVLASQCPSYLWWERWMSRFSGYKRSRRYRSFVLTLILRKLYDVRTISSTEESALGKWLSWFDARAQ